MAKGKSNKESCNNSHYCAPFFPLLVYKHLRGSCYDEQLSRLLFNRQATSLATAVVDFLLAPQARAKIACSSCNPSFAAFIQFPWTQSCSSVTSPYNPWQTLTSLFFFPLWDGGGGLWDTWEAQDPAVLYERQYINNWSTLQRSGGGIMAVKRHRHRWIALYGI